MEKSNKIGAIILGAAAALAIYKYTQMTKEERDEFFSTIRDKTQDLLEDADNTVEKVQHYVAQFKDKQPDQWFDKLYVIRKMFSDFYGITPKGKTQGLPSMS